VIARCLLVSLAVGRLSNTSGRGTTCTNRQSLVRLGHRPARRSRAPSRTCLPSLLGQPSRTDPDCRLGRPVIALPSRVDQQRGEVKRSRRLGADLLTANEIEGLLRACSHRAPTGIRNRAMLAVAWRGGLCIGEVLALRPKDIDLGSGTIVVQHGKDDKTPSRGHRCRDNRAPCPLARGTTDEASGGSFPQPHAHPRQSLRAVESRQAWGRRLRLAAFAPSD
jgi:integrase